MLKDQCEIVRSMKINEVLRDKSFRLISCFYVFLGILIFHFEAFSQSAKGNYVLMIPNDNHWYNEPWIWAVMTALLILLVAISGRVDEPSDTMEEIS